MSSGMEMFMAQASDEQKVAIMETMEEMQMDETRRMYGNLAAHCFKECVQNFRSSELAAAEKTCIQNCCEKFMKSYVRVGARFAEQTMAQQQANQAQMQAQMMGQAPAQPPK